jgi:hypothetical protein
MPNNKMQCWVCGGTDFKQVSSDIPFAVSADHFKITDSQYGLTLP